MKQIFIFRKTYAAVILIGYLMAFSSAMAQHRQSGAGVSALYRWLAEEYRYDSKDE